MSIKNRRLTFGLLLDSVFSGFHKCIFSGITDFVNNEKGILELLSHIVDVHEYKRLALITGPEKNYESQVRVNAYKKFLQSRNIPFDPGLVVEGNFTGNSGRNAVKILREKRKVTFDVIVALNDLMALGAIEELVYAGIEVPGDTFIAGFDDIEKNIEE